MAHMTSPAAEALLDTPVPVLDHGFVRLVDYLGTDSRIVQSARVSYGEGTKTVRQDKGLIAYLLRNEHMSPFEQVVFTFHVKMPIFVARQWVRHRTARMNEISGRYSVLPSEFYLPEAADLCYQRTDNRQGRDEQRDVPPELTHKVLDYLKNDAETCYGHYQEMLSDDLSREIARINLPLALYTEMYWQIDLRNLLHFIRLRMDNHAQKEIRVYAEVLAKAVEAVTPYAWEAFEEHVLHAKKLSRSQAQKLSLFLATANPALKDELEL